MRILFSFLIIGFASNLAFAQCENDPKGLIKNFTEHVRMQRNLLVSAKSQVIYRSFGGGHTDTAEYTRTYTAADGKMAYNLVSADRLPRPIRMTVERDSTLSIDDRRRIEFSDENYSFEYLPDSPSSKFLRFKLIPVENREGLVNGEFWFDKATCLPWRVFGHVIQHHILVRLMDVDEDMQFVNGLMLPHIITIKYRVFAIVKTISGAIEATSIYKPEDVIVNREALRAATN